LRVQASSRGPPVTLMEPSLTRRIRSPIHGEGPPCGQRHRAAAAHHGGAPRERTTAPAVR
jgi:hypothetical protein